MAKVARVAGRALLLYVVLGLPAIWLDRVVGSGAGLPLLNGVILFGALYSKLGFTRWAGVSVLGAAAVFLSATFAGQALPLALVLGGAAVIAGLGSRWGHQMSLIVVPLNAAVLSQNPVDLSAGQRSSLLLIGSVYGAIALTLLRVKPTPKAPPIPERAAIVFAIMFGLVVGIGTYVVTRIDLAHGYWLAVTFIAVMQPTFADSTTKTFQRVIGTIVGAGAALVLGEVISDGLSGAIGFAFLIAWSVLTLGDWIRNALLTIGVLLIVGGTTDLAATAEVRLVFTLVGGAIVLGVSYLIPYVVNLVARAEGSPSSV
jgi:uncharacterized membrane protein YccC